MKEVEFLHSWHVGIAEAYEGLFLNPTLLKRLTSVEQELILVGVYASLGDEEEVVTHGNNAMSAGASPNAIVEAVLTAAISRGRKALKTALPFLNTLKIENVEWDQHRSDHSPLTYFASEFEKLPEWVKRMEIASANALGHYALLRKHILTEGAAKRKTKELLTMLLNAIMTNPSGIASHALSARRHGATREEILETFLLGVTVGGIVVWINGVNALSECHDIF
jgi:alkylhydroperoxidase/carboxymuconolactone decarboxylase family protein YurZ